MFYRNNGSLAVIEVLPPQFHSFVKCIFAEGNPNAGGDYSPNSDRYVFRPRQTRPCVDVFIFSDQLFELQEEFRGRVLGILQNDGTVVTRVNGVTIQPAETTVTITDSDRKSH